jgi:hypothetical protein
MPHFNPKKYDPAADSSESCHGYADRTHFLTLEISTDAEGRASCPCGCNEFPVGKKAVFLMGHDARMRGKLIRAHMTDTSVVFASEGGWSQPATAMDIAVRYGESFVDALKAAVLRRDGKNREVVISALNSDRLIKVGRWSYTGQVVAVYGKAGDEEYDIEYVTKTGEKRRVRVPADQAPLA